MFLYSNWGGSEPNNSGYAYMNIGAVHASIQTGQWADDSRDQGYPEPGYDPVIGFFVEYEAPYAVPDAAASWSFLTLALGGLAALKRRIHLPNRLSK
jgi:hypothetical protein